ncbi:molybdenum cofactor biosynthesis protein MoaE [Helicobacter baculiformis]|uniref:Molybdopterin synthase catalytic subunit n=1 Tax=Helicobacter baculiformis TaxID=427351 RepID=A0ABV7ZJW9_9HELI|nr:MULTISPECIES: molybdenum cofactor biosynthesis protein MoaE [Helicobacter]
MLEVVEGALDTARFYTQWERECVAHNCGAFCVFTGVVRAQESEFEGLSFDVHMPLLQAWFQDWQTKAQARGVVLKMAHSRGDVLVSQSSYMVGLMSEHRQAPLELYGAFIEDFKHNAPIWKYYLQNKQRVYAKDQSHPLKGSGLLA